ncbi:MAG: polymer-forming cytoskeletal protein [Pseudomonadales bacterium]|nr:polymer-forming cytoskeletal protein [Pseudomonadales bacterium]
MFGRDSSKESNKKDGDRIKEDSDGATEQSASSTFSSNHSLPRSTAMIGQSIQIKGTVTGAENLVIEGTIEGSVELPDHDLTVGESGQVTADLDAKNVKVDGQVTGDIKGSEKVVISKTGRVRGNITAPRVTLEDGAKFKGSIDMDPGETAKPAAKVEPKAAAPSAGVKQEAS